MYCKNCGKSLPDDARFCDRCNVSVRKKSDKQELIDELKEERLARRQAKAVEERLKKIKKVKTKKVKTGVAASVTVLLIGVLSFVLGWFIVRPDSKNIETGTIKEAETQEPTATPEIVTVGGANDLKVAAPSAKPTAAPLEAKLNADGYYVTNLGGKEFAYPVNFKSNENSASALLSLNDIMGEATLVVQKSTTSSSAEELMRQCISTKGGEVMEKISDGREYEVSLAVGDEIYHRKGCVAEGAEVFYEISYPADTQNRQRYIDYIEYMDAFFTEK